MAEMQTEAQPVFSEEMTQEIRPKVARVHTEGKLARGRPRLIRDLHAALEAASAAAMRAALRPQAVLSLAEMAQLTRHLEDLDEPTARLRLGIVHTYTSEMLDPYIRFEARLQGLDVDLYHAPYGVTLQETEDGSGLRTQQPDLTLLL